MASALLNNKTFYRWSVEGIGRMLCAIDSHAADHLLLPVRPIDRTGLHRHASKVTYLWCVGSVQECTRVFERSLFARGTERVKDL